MSMLLETQRAIYRSLVESDDGAAAQHVVADGLAPAARLNIHRNTFVATLTTALQLSFPAVHRVVGAEFFESAARIFIEGAPPQSAYLDEYGADFADFLDGFPPVASLPYLPGLARLEWAVSRALHAPDVEAVAIAGLSAVPLECHGRITFEPHPSVGLVAANYPVDQIWGAVLAQDDAAMAAVDLDSGPVALLVERRESDVDVTRMDESAWQFMTMLCARRQLQDAMDTVPDLDVATTLAEHLTSGRFVDVAVAAQNDTKQ